MWVTLECVWCAQQKSSYSDPGQIAEGWTGTPCLGGLKVWATECRDPQVLQDQNCFQRNVTHDYQAEYNAIHNKDESAPSLLCVRWLLTGTGSRLLCSSPGGTQVRKRRAAAPVTQPDRFLLLCGMNADRMSSLEAGQVLLQGHSVHFLPEPPPSSTDTTVIQVLVLG